MRKPVICGIGITSLDHFAIVPYHPHRNEKLEARETATMPGGPVCNALVTAAALGLEARLLAVLGTGMEAEFIREHLRLFGLRTDYLVLDESYKTPRAFIWVDGRTGERSVVLDKTTSRMPRLSDVGPEFWTDADIVLTDGRGCPDLLEILMEARNRRIPIVVDAGSVRDSMQQVLELADHIITSREFACEFTGKSSPKKALMDLVLRFRKPVAVTLGHQGVIAAETGVHPIRIPAFRVAVIDTTGAGDVFHGAFCAAMCGLESDRTFVSCLRYASAAAAVSCLRLGGCHPDLDPVVISGMIKMIQV